VVDLGFGGEAGEREAEAAASFCGGEAHGEQDVRGFGGAGLASCAEAGGDALHVERDEERFGVDACEAEVGGVGGAVRNGAVDVDVGDGGEEAGFEAVAALREGCGAGTAGLSAADSPLSSGRRNKSRSFAAFRMTKFNEACGVFGIFDDRFLESGSQVFDGYFGGAAEGYDAGDVFGSGAALAFVRAAVEERRELHAFADEEDAGALRGVHLVAGEREQVDVFEVEREVERELGGGLHGVGMDEDGGVEGLGDAGKFAEGLDGSGLVVGEHDGDEPGVRLERGFKGGGVDDAVGVGSEVGDFDAAGFERLRGVEDGVVLDLGGDEVGWLVLVEIALQYAEERKVVALGAAGGEDDLFGGAVEHPGDAGSCMLDGGACALARLVCGTRVAETCSEIRQHGLDDLGQDRGSGVGVEVDALHRLILSLREAR
jgi:hypothetical protein